MNQIDNLVDELVDIAKLAMQFGRTFRATLHPDGHFYEDDAEHTVMLQLVVGTVFRAIGEEKRKELGLDLSLAVRYALVHDLPEALVGDTDAYRITPEAQAAKKQREAGAIERLRQTFVGRSDWIPHLILQYEEQGDVNARLVRFLDKILPKLTHSLNQAQVLRRKGETSEGLRQALDTQLAALLRDSPDLAFLSDLFHATSRLTIEALQEPVMTKPKLVQRMNHIRDARPNLDGLWRDWVPEYMGAAEFEWGILAEKLGKMKAVRDGFEIVEVTTPALRGKQLFALRTSNVADILVPMAERSMIDVDYPHDWFLKERTLMLQAFGFDSERGANVPRPDMAWWVLDAPTPFVFTQTREAAENWLAHLRGSA